VRAEVGKQALFRYKQISHTTKQVVLREAQCRRSGVHLMLSGGGMGEGWGQREEREASQASGSREHCHQRDQLVRFLEPAQSWHCLEPGRWQHTQEEVSRAIEAGKESGN
jgi:hypothetical protein